MFNETKRDSSFLQGTKKTATLSRVNEGLRAYLLRVYQLMGLGLLVSAATAFLGATDSFFSLLYTQTARGIESTPVFWIIAIAPFVLVFIFGAAVRRINPAKAQMIFWIFSALMGFSFSALLRFLTPESLFQTFIVAAASFGGLCLYGYSTNRDLTKIGAFMNMGLWGLLAAIVVNWFMKSGPFAYGISIVGVVIFAGLTAYDTQKIKMIYNESDASDVTQTKAISGALELYLDFINLFIMLLRLMGNRK